MNKKKLAIELSKLAKLNKLNVNLEQYQTESEFAADLLWLAYQEGDVKGKVVADFGCGNGILGIGALLLGAKLVYFLDSDEDALDICKSNINNLGFKNFEIINSDISNFNIKVDTVVMNPPFGVQKRKADKIFLEVAMKYSDNVYSIHKIESKNFINILAKENNFGVLNVIEREFLLKKSYKFHSRKNYSFKVGIWILKRNV